MEAQPERAEADSQQQARVIAMACRGRQLLALEAIVLVTGQQEIQLLPEVQGLAKP